MANKKDKSLARGRAKRQTAHDASKSSLSAEVVRLFRRCGYLRQPPKLKGEADEAFVSHRGYEVRFMAHSRDECLKIVRTLKASRIKPGKPFNKGRQWRVPVYGRQVFLAIKDSG